MNNQTEDLYREAMDGIGMKIALQAIRKVLRSSEIPDGQKLERIVTIVHSFERDMKGE